MDFIKTQKSRYYENKTSFVIKIKKNQWLDIMGYFIAKNSFAGEVTLKVAPATFLLVSLKEGTCKTKKNVFLFNFESLFRSWNNQILAFQDIEMSQRNQMSKYETRNTFYWITSEVNGVVVKFGQFM